jgi:hypothetical protein
LTILMREGDRGIKNGAIKCEKYHKRIKRQRQTSE